MMGGFKLLVAQTIHAQHHAGSIENSSRENALFCKNFVIDTILKIKKTNHEPVVHEYLVKRKFKVKYDENIIVWHTTDAEVITKVNVGEVLFGHEHQGNDGYVAISFEGDSAYIKASVLKNN